MCEENKHYLVTVRLCVLSKKAVTAYCLSKQLLSFDFTELYTYVCRPGVS